MAGIVKLRYTPLLVGAGETLSITSDTIGGFLCVTAGTISISRKNEDNTTTALVTALPVSAGVWVDIPFYLGTWGGTITSATAVGVLAT